MNPLFRLAGAAMCALGSALIVPAPALADAYPAKPVRIVVPFAAGGAIDVIVRAVSPQLAKELGQPIVIDNRPGAGGNIGSEAVATSAPDGYTLLAGTSATHGAKAGLFAKLPYDPRKDFVPIAHLSGVPNVLVVTPASGIKSVDDLLKLARQSPGKLTFGSAGNGTSLHLAGELFAAEAKVELVHVPYKGGAPATTDLLGGQITMMFNTVPVALPQIRGGKLVPLAVTAGKRHFALPDVPTFAEIGYKGMIVATWTGLFAPTGTPKGIVEKVAGAVERSLQDKAVAEALRSQGAEPEYMAPDAFARYVDSEIARWTKVIRALNIKPD